MGSRIVQKARHRKTWPPCVPGALRVGLDSQVSLEESDLAREELRDAEISGPRTTQGPIFCGTNHVLDAKS